MKRIYFTAFAILLLAGCSSKADSQTQPQMTQEINTESLSSTETTPVYSTTDFSSTPVDSTSTLAESANISANTSSYAQHANSDYNQLLQRYCSVKAELDAIDIEEDMLEAKYRIGKIETAAFTAQKTALSSQEDTLKIQEVQSKLDLRQASSPPILPKGDKQDLLRRLYQLESDENALELQEEYLESKYRDGTISRQDYISQQTALLIQDDTIEQENDLVEQALKLLGWDD